MTRSHGSLPGLPRPQLQLLMAEIKVGIVFVEADGSIPWANDAALAMHGCGSLKLLGTSVAAYARRFGLRYRDGQGLEEADYPASRALRGETLQGVVVEVGSQSPSENL